MRGEFPDSTGWADGGAMSRGANAHPIDLFRRSAGPWFRFLASLTLAVPVRSRKCQWQSIL